MAGFTRSYVENKLEFCHGGILLLKSKKQDTEIFKTDEYGALLVQKTLRSGQSITHDGSVIVIGDVNPGAEVIAGGNVIVMGSVRGVIHAGAFGNTGATVTALRLIPTQIRIASQITRPTDEVEVESDQPEIARIRAGNLVIEKLKLT